MKRMSPAGVTFVVGAILVGLAAAYAVRHLSQSTPQEAKASPRRTKTIVVAKYNLPQYARITEDYIDEVQVPADKVPEGALTLKSRALYRLAKGTILAGQPIRDEDLYAVGEVPLLSERLPPGYRAVTLAVDAKAAVNGMIQPESLVDITLTVKNERPEIGGLATLTLLRRVRVLATSRNRFPASEDRPGDLRNITVAVTPEQANKLILAEKYGTLSVVLCSKLDEDTPESELDAATAAAGHVTAIPASNPTVATTDRTFSEDRNDLVNIYSLLGISPLTPEPMPEKPITRTAQIWRGGSVEEVTFVEWQIQEAENATLVAEGKSPRPFTPGTLTSSPGSSKHSESEAEDCPECALKRAKEAAARSLGEKPVPTPAPQPASRGNDQASQSSVGYGRIVTVPMQVQFAN